MQNTILGMGHGNTCSGLWISGGHNLDEFDDCGLSDPTDLGGMPPRMGPPEDNGGPLPTCRLYATSPAVDAGGDAVCPPTDQRGKLRPQDGDADSIAACDIGAFEVVDCNGNARDDSSDISYGRSTDCNGNGIPDECESPDVDGDGVSDICDTCIDMDGDGLGDPGYPGNTCPEDGCPDDPAKGEPGVCGCGVVDTDTDGDGVLDCVDNCPAVPNADQADGNGNGIGDACEASPGPAAVPGCGACGVGLYPMIPLMLLGLLRRRRR